jgi:hypothetical protein
MQVLAKEIIHSRKAVSRLYVNKAQMISLGHALTEQLGKQSRAKRQGQGPVAAALGKGILLCANAGATVLYCGLMWEQRGTAARTILVRNCSRRAKQQQ